MAGFILGTLANGYRWDWVSYSINWTQQGWALDCLTAFSERMLSRSPVLLSGCAQIAISYWCGSSDNATVKHFSRHCEDRVHFTVWLQCSWPGVHEIHMKFSQFLLKTGGLGLIIGVGITFFHFHTYFHKSNHIRSVITKKMDERKEWRMNERK